MLYGIGLHAVQDTRLPKATHSAWRNHDRNIHTHISKNKITSDIFLITCLVKHVWSLAHKQLETLWCVLGTIATDALVLKHQAISIHSSQCWPSYMSSHGVTVLQWVNWSLWCDANKTWSNLHMMTSSNGNIFRVTGPFYGEFIGHRCPITKGSDAELWCFPWSAPGQTVDQIIETPVIWDAIAPIMTSL